MFVPTFAVVPSAPVFTNVPYPLNPCPACFSSLSMGSLKLYPVSILNPAEFSIPLGPNIPPFCKYSLPSPLLNKNLHPSAPVVTD